MSTSQFTYRDFVVYFITGVVALLSIALIYNSSLNTETGNFFRNYKIVEQLKILVSISAIGIIYLMGHIIHSIDYDLGVLYRFFYTFNEKHKNYRALYKCRKFIESIVYRHRITYNISESIKADKESNIPFKKPEDFWQICAELQISNSYGNSEYWYSLNDLFKGLYLVFCTSTLLSIYEKNIFLTVIFFSLSFISLRRAKQFSNHFIKTVIRNYKAKKLIS